MYKTSVAFRICTSSYFIQMEEGMVGSTTTLIFHTQVQFGEAIMNVGELFDTLDIS